MIISYYGGQTFKISQGDFTLGYNPISKDSLSNPPRFGADVALVSVNHADYNGVEQLSHGERVPFVINGPGSYEVKDLSIIGVMTEILLDDEKYINTSYAVTIEGITLGFLGAIQNPKIEGEVREAFSNVNILFVPIGGNGVLSPSDAAKVAVSFDANIIIPMDIEKGEKDCLKKFLKEVGQENADTVEKLSLKKREIEAMNGTVIVLKS